MSLARTRAGGLLPVGRFKDDPLLGHAVLGEPDCFLFWYEQDLIIT